MQGGRFWKKERKKEGKKERKKERKKDEVKMGEKEKGLLVEQTDRDRDRDRDGEEKKICDDVGN